MHHIGQVARFAEKLKAHVAALSPESRKSGVLLNVVADRKLPYAQIFSVIQVFRQAGFDLLLFVKTGKGPAPGEAGGSGP